MSEELKQMLVDAHNQRVRERSTEIMEAETLSDHDYVFDQPTEALIVQGIDGTALVQQRGGDHLTYWMDEGCISLVEIFDSLAPGVYVCTCVLVGEEDDLDLDYTVRPLTVKEWRDFALHNAIWGTT